MSALSYILYSERMVGQDSPDYSDTLNRALKQAVVASGVAADVNPFPGFALRPAVDPTAGQFYRASSTTPSSAAWATMVTAMISDLTTAATGITKVGTINTGVWQGSSIATTYTDAKIKTVTGTVDRVTVGGTSTDPTFDIAATYAGQTSITTLGTISTGIWHGSSIGTAYTDAQVVSISGTSSRITVGGTATVPIIDISASYVGQTSIVTLGTVTTGVWHGTSIGTGFTDAKVVSISGTASRVSVAGTATVPVIDIDAAYIGQSSITTLGTITTGVWHGTAVATAYTVAQLVTLTGTLNRVVIGGTSTDPTVDISSSYVGQNSITTLGTIGTGVWQGSSIATTFTDAKVKTVTGTANRLSIGGTATDPTFDISASYVGQATITTLGTIATGTWAASTISVDKGGTGLTSYTIGDLLYSSGATTLSKLAGNTTTQAQVLMQTGTGSASQAPVWHTLVTADITDLTSASTGITKLGTVTTGVWNGTIVAGTYGGTGVNNGAFTITLGGNLATSGAFNLTLTLTAGTNVTLPTSGTLVNTAVTSLASLTSVGGAFAISGAFTGATTGVFSSTVTASGLIISAAAGTLVPGATSFSLRNNANNADNLIVTDAGAITVRNSISGVTTLTATTLAGTLSTAAQPNVTSTGVLASLHATSMTVDSGGLTITAGGLTISGAASITGGAGNMTITAGTGVSRTLSLQSTTSGSVATTFLVGNADQSVTFGGAVANVLLANGQSTGASYGKFHNTSGEMIYGTDGSSPVISSGSAYEGFVGTNVAKPFNLIYNGGVVAKIGNGTMLVRNTAGGSDPAAGDYALAAALGDSLTVSQIFYVINSGNRGNAGNAAGSALVRFSFNDHDAFIIDKNGVTAPACYVAANWIISATHGAASGNQGFLVSYAADPNDTGHEFFYGQGNGTLRASIRGNGGLANFSANNVNLSDERTKTFGKDIDGAAFAEVFRRARVRSFRYNDQTHNDWNIGMGAQGWRSVLEEVVPEFANSIVDLAGWKNLDGSSMMAIYEADLAHAHVAVTKYVISVVDDHGAKLNNHEGRIKNLEARLN